MQELATAVKELYTGNQNIKEIEKVEIKTPDDLDKYAGWLVSIKGKLKTTDVQRHFFTDPIEKHKKDIIALFKPKQEFYKKSINILNKKILCYKQAQAALLAAEQAKNPTAIIEAPDRKIKTQSGTISTKSTWKWEAGDIKDVDPKYLSTIVNARLLDEAVSNGERKIKGIRIFQEESLAVYTK